MIKTWKILTQINLNIKPEEKAILKILLKNRKITKNRDVEEFLNPKGVSDLEPRDFEIDKSDLKKTVERIKKAIKNQERIIVWGDYDADGISATALVWEAIYKAGGQVLPYIPSRLREGYGLNKEGIKKLFEGGQKGIIVTVDNGIVAHREIKFAREMGIDVIVTDHHLPEKESFPGDFLIHTTLTSGSGIAWLLANQFGVSDAGLASIGILADMIPLKKVNRSLVREGLREIGKTKRLGLISLLEKAGIRDREITSWDIHFIIAPRLNALGRMEEALDSLRLLCTKNFSQAHEIALRLETTNKERQKTMEENLRKARDLIVSKKKIPELIFICGRDYHEGVLGLVAGRLVEEFFRPAIVVHKKRDFSKGSARSVNGFNIIEAIRKMEKILKNTGGHPLAAGFTIKTEYLERFGKGMLRIAKESLKGKENDLLPELKIDFEVKLSWLNLSFYEAISKLKPFGFGNPEPLFLLKNLRVTSVKTVGSNGGHLKLWLDDPETKIIERQEAEAIGFGMGDWASKLLPGDAVDLIFNLDINEWQGRRGLQLKIKDLKLSN